MSQREKHLNELVQISREFGGNKEFVIAGGGNTSYKDKDTIWVKASGTNLATIDIEGFAALDRGKLGVIYERHYSSDATQREAEVKSDLAAACITGPALRPSVETSLHDVIDYSFIVHTHPTIVNAVTCSRNAFDVLTGLFGNDSLYVPYTDPGYILFTKVREMLEKWRRTNSDDPKMIFLQNHGVFVAADTAEEIRTIYAEIERKIKGLVSVVLPQEDLQIEMPDDIVSLLPAMRMVLSVDKPKVAMTRTGSLEQHFTSGRDNFSKVSLPFTPDQIVYCRSTPLYLESQGTQALIDEFTEKLDEYRAKHQYDPKVVGIRNYGIVTFEDNTRAAGILQDVFTDWMKVSRLSENFGGPSFMSAKSIEFIENWEVENYRRKASVSSRPAGRLDGKIAVVTGGAQGFGAGIAGHLIIEGANVVIADLNEEKGRETVAEINSKAMSNRAVFVKTDVTSATSVENLVKNAVTSFGGIDLFISNAGILRAGGLNEMSPETFELMTKVNYNAYFLCVKYVSPVMILQSKYREGHFTDIIQINSKSGLKGSNRNFAYAGGKFGGIGLTQSFALELMPHRIKVNSICPGNFFEGPLWSDPENGLFVQYLRTGKVPGAKNIDDVRKHYERQVPAGRGCRVEDVMKAIYYVVEQEYETGQAVPVTGGQEMLS